MVDVIALGELLIDFTMVNTPSGEAGMFQRNPGGAPANVLAALAKLHKKTAFIGKVGEDSFGHFLKDVLATNGIDVTGLVFSETENTTLAFVELDSTGERSFTFYRKPGADRMLKEDEVKTELLRACRIFHFGSISLTHEPARSATLFAVGTAKTSGALISYDPNIRLGLWPSEAVAKEQILAAMPLADMVKVSEEELAFLFETTDLEEGSEIMWKQFGLNLILITLGSEGCFYRCGEKTGRVGGFRVPVVDTTGAGDSFVGGVMVKLLEQSEPLDRLSQAELEMIVTFGNATGALATTKKGAIPAMPTMEEVNALIASSRM